MQRLAFDELHHEKADVVLLADVVERANVRMVQLSDRFGFAIEAFLAFRIVPNRPSSMGPTISCTPSVAPADEDIA